MVRIAIQRTLAAAVGVGSMLNAAAQERAAATQGAGLEEIVVTAQRRVENLQDVPIAATAIPGEELRSKAVARMGDLQFASPALVVTDTGIRNGSER